MSGKRDLAHVEQAEPATRAPLRSIEQASETVLEVLIPRNFEQALAFSEIIAKSDLAPKDYQGKPGNVLVAMQLGAEVGLSPMQAIQNIAVINGRPSLWGDALLALVKNSRTCEFIKESEFEEIKKTQEAWCVAKRRRQDPVRRTFSMDDAKRAGLAEKAGPWKQYPFRMLQMRARGFALRDAFPDVLKGLHVAEEIIDIEPEPNRVIDAAAAEQQKQLTVAQEKLKERREAEQEPLPPQTLAEGPNLAQASSESDELIPDDRWVRVINYLDADRGRSSLKTKVKKTMHIESLARLLPHERPLFLRTYEDVAKKTGMTMAWPE